MFRYFRKCSTAWPSYYCWQPLASNRGCATDPSVRKQLQLQGLLPPGQGSQAVEVLRAKEALAQASSPMAKYRQLMTLRETDASTFYALLQQVRCSYPAAARNTAEGYHMGKQQDWL